MKVRDLADWASHFHTAMSVLNALRGGPVHEDAPALVKGMKGLFGMKDEREFQNLLVLLEVEIPGASQVITDFIGWHFNATRYGKVLVWYYGNKFRVFVTGLGGSEAGVSFLKLMHSILISRNGKQKFLRHMVRTGIPHIPRGKKERMDQLVAIAIATKDLTANKVAVTIATIDQKITEMRTALEEHNQRVAAARTGFWWWLYNRL